LFERVLVSTDFSKYSQKVIESVGEIPGVKEVVLLHIMAAPGLARVWDPGARAEDAKKRLDEEAKPLESLGIAVKKRAEPLVGGEVAKKIDIVSEEEEGVDLVVIGVRSKGFVGKVLLGSVAKDILRYGTKNLLLMRLLPIEGGERFEKHSSMIFSKILCPTDFSEPAEDAIKILKDIKGVEEVVLLTVLSKDLADVDLESEKEEAEEKLAAIKAGFEDSGIAASVRVAVGSPAKEIITAAEDEEVSLIAMSSHGKGWVRQMIVGSVAYDVSNSGTRPVLVLRVV
jgi:nucleotide-binding universal stress UspA family protein